MPNLKSVSLNVPKDAMKKDTKLQAHLVDRSGRLVETVTLKQGRNGIKRSAKEFNGNTKIFVSPPFPSDFPKDRITEQTLIRADAHQLSFRLGKDNVVDIGSITDITFPPPFSFCRVTGSLSKSFTISGVSEPYPVCNARVHICEVDKVSLWRPVLPDDIVLGIRDRLVNPKIAGSIPRDPLTSAPGLFANLSDRIPSVQGLPLNIELSAELRANLISTSIPIIREAIIDNFELLRPYFCFWPKYWPWLYRCDELAVALTDSNGRFSTRFFNVLGEDRPDIYIWVEVLHNGEWVTVYKPNIACHTYWDYKCGTNINLRLNDARIGLCQGTPLDEAVVWIKRVNSLASIRGIQQVDTPSGHLENAVGLTAHARGANISPFGATFPFVVLFGDGLASINISFYRWSYRKLKDAKLNSNVSSVQYLRSNVNRPYTFPTGVDNNYETAFASLGPVDTFDKPTYKIPPINPPSGGWDNVDTNSISVNSQSLDNGLYEFKLELLDAAGNIVPTPPNTFQIDTTESSLQSETPPDIYLDKNAAGQALAFHFKMRIDNESCYADILDAQIADADTDECGIGRYANSSDLVAFKFLAGHPQDFATYDFRTTRGNSHPVQKASSIGSADSPEVPDVPPTTVINNGFAVSSEVAGNLYQKNVSVSTLLEGTECTEAAFAQVLRVTATHTDGNNRGVGGYNRSDTAAIAISDTDA